MKALKRRTELLALINATGAVSLKELTSRFDVTKMTIHRDLEFLEKRGLIRRIFGGAMPVEGAGSVTPAAPPPPARDQLPAPAGDSCLVCRRPVSQHLLYGITLTTGAQQYACCPHCGLSAHLRQREKIATAMTADFISGRPHPAHRSFFVMGSSAAPSCTPSILAFENGDQARRFQAGFGGKVGTLQEALDFLQEEMSLESGRKGCPHCAAAP